MSVRVRFAPSPTGYLHVGGARTALFNYLFAKKYKGKFILRIEDTDQARHQESAIESLKQALLWLGLKWDEGPYRQTERQEIYSKYIEQLLQEGHAYYCFLTEKDILEQKSQNKDKSFKIASPYRDLSLKEAKEKKQAGALACVRFKTPKEQEHYTIEDIVRGRITMPSDTAGDFILQRSDGLPVYNFSCAVDDALMKISHVFRGEEHLSNSVKQIMIQKALGMQAPQLGHLSVILDENKKKLSKREGAENVEHLKDEGLLPEALCNFLSLLGWNPGTEQEYFKEDELIQAFSEKGLNASSAVFDKEKMLWLNSEHIKNMEDKELWKCLLPFLDKAGLSFEDDPAWRASVLKELKSGFKTLKQAVEILKPLSNEGFSVSEQAKEVISWETSKPFIKRWLQSLENSKGEYLSLEDFKKIADNIRGNLKGKEFFMPLRCALLGHPQGAEVKVIVTLLKIQELKRRASLCLS